MLCLRNKKINFSIHTQSSLSRRIVRNSPKNCNITHTFKEKKIASNEYNKRCHEKISFAQPNSRQSKLDVCSYCLLIDIANNKEPGPKVIKLFPCSTQLSMKFILLINVKMPTIVGILTFISRINTTSESLKARKSAFFSILVFMSR